MCKRARRAARGMQARGRYHLIEEIWFRGVTLRSLRHIAQLELGNEGGECQSKEKYTESASIEEENEVKDKIDIKSNWRLNRGQL